MGIVLKLICNDLLLAFTVILMLSKWFQICLSQARRGFGEN